MNQELRTRIERLDALFQQRRSIDEQIGAILEEGATPAPLLSVSDAVVSMRRRTPSVIPTLHTYVEAVLKQDPSGMTTDALFIRLKETYPDVTCTQQETTASLVYLTHKRGTAERIGQGRYRIRST